MINLETTGILMQGGWLDYYINSFTAATSNKFYNEFNEMHGGFAPLLIDYMTIDVKSNINNITISVETTGNWLRIYDYEPSGLMSPNYSITGSNNFKGYVTVVSNGDSSARFGLLKISCVEYYKEYVIVQVGSAARLLFLDKTIIFPYNAPERIPVRIDSNVTWTLTRDVGNWFYIYETKTGGTQLTSLSKEGSKTVYISANSHAGSTENRIGKLKVTDGTIVDYCEIYQSAEHYLIIKPVTREYSHEGGEFAVTIESSIPNDTITIANNTVGIIDSLPTTITTYASNVSILYFDVNAYNDTSYNRIGQINFSNSNFSKFHKLLQQKKPVNWFISVDKTELVFTSSPQSDEVKVTTNIPTGSLTITSSVGWITANFNTTSKILTIIVAKNESNNDFRDGYVTIASTPTYGSISRRIDVYQMYYISGGGGATGEDYFDYSICDCTQYTNGSIEYKNCITSCYLAHINFQVE